MTKTVAGWVVVAAMALGAAACSSPEQQAMKRSTELIEALRQKSIPGLPASLTQEQATNIDHARSGAGAWFVETGCFTCHAVSVYDVKSFTNMGPDLSLAVDDVQKRFGKNLDEFWHEPIGTMMMVRSQLIKMSPEEEAVALGKLKAAYAEYQRKQGVTANAQAK